LDDILNDMTSRFQGQECCGKVLIWLKITYPLPLPLLGKGKITKRGANAPLKHPATELEIYWSKELAWRGRSHLPKTLPLSQVRGEIYPLNVIERSPRGASAPLSIFPPLLFRRGGLRG
jgi:hypothetical protein